MKSAIRFKSNQHTPARRLPPEVCTPSPGAYPYRLLMKCDKPTPIYADHMAACWPAIKVECVGSYTVLSRVPISQAAPVAEDIAALATAYSMEIPDEPL